MSTISWFPRRPPEQRTRSSLASSSDAILGLVSGENAGTGVWFAGSASTYHSFADAIRRVSAEWWFQGRQLLLSRYRDECLGVQWHIPGRDHTHHAVFCRHLIGRVRDQDACSRLPSCAGVWQRGCCELLWTADSIWKFQLDRGFAYYQDAAAG